jgi:RecB family exonuclease
VAHISASQINMFLRCPAQYKYRYIDGIILPPKSALTKGKAVHAGQEHNYKQKIDTLQDVKLSEVQEVTAAAFEEQASITEWDREEDPGKVKDSAVVLASLYHTEIAPTVQPILVEEKIEIPIAGTTLLGFIDVLDSKGYIRDTKTASKTPAESEIDKSLQLTAYSMAHRELMGVPERGVKLDYLVNTKVPKVVTLEAVRTEQDITRFTRIVERVKGAIDAKAFYPNPGNQLCSEKWCGYWAECHKEF